MKVVVKIVILSLVVIVVMLEGVIFGIEREVNVEEKTPVINQTPIIKSTTETITQPKETTILTKAPEPVPTEILFSDLAPTINMSVEELTYDDSYVGENPTPPPADTYKLVVNIYYQFITVFGKDNEGRFNVPIRYMVCSTGKRSTPTPTGNFTMDKTRIRIITSDEKSYARYASQLVEGIYFHSLLYRKWNDVTSYTKTSYNNLGKRASHGCIRLWIPDAKWIFYNVASGTEVEIVEGEEDKRLAQIRAQLIFPPYPKH